MKVSELRPRVKVPSIDLTIIEKGEIRSVTTRDGAAGRVCDAKGEDDDGQSVSISLWNDEIERVNVSDRIRITNGWVSEWRGSKQLSAGRYGQLEVLK
jgi:ssDNA-binding replication factor A large subunit